MNDFSRGNELLRNGKLEEAVAAYQKAIANYPNFHWSHYKLGEALEQLNRWEEAIAAYEKAIALNSNCGWSYYSLAMAMARQGEWEEGIANYRKAVEINPDLQQLQSSLHSAVQLESLKKLFPFPNVNEVDSFYFSLDGGGRDLVINTIHKNAVKLMLEIGVFLGGSAIQWLESTHNLTVIGVDPWNSDFASVLENYDSRPAFKHCFKAIKDRKAFIQSVRQHGAYISATANMKKYKDRFIPVQSYSPQILYELHNLGVIPELIYFDNNKNLNDLEICFELFPEAILSGDDWTWGANQGFPVQNKVNDFCQRHGFSVQVKSATWMLSKS
ncbi:tetratricopeptide repeat protein [Limnospira platensis]|uniref:tetratricopeptide repeat protein n=1 Tax=Limnospira platensis TaxID=118562 RepID=UPI003D6DF64B